jgi:hypothetical protein
MAKQTSGTGMSGSTARKDTALHIELVCEEILQKLQALQIEPGLQADIQWCLGSYRHDKNPVGLYQMAERALPLLRKQKEKKPRTVSARLIANVEKALKQRNS